MHVNDRGTHTTIIESAENVISFFSKNRHLGVTVSPGKIEGGVGAKSKSIKLKHLNNETYEMVITFNGTRQEFKIFTHTETKTLISEMKADKKLRIWNINYTDMRGVHKIK